MAYDLTQPEFWADEDVCHPGKGVNCGELTPMQNCAPTDEKRKDRGPQGSPATELLNKARSVRCGVLTAHGLSDFAQGLGEVVDQVAGGLEADRDANHRIGQADLLAHFLGNISVSMTPGMLDQGFCAAQTYRKTANLDIIENREGLFLAALDIIAKEPQRQKRLADNAQYLRTRLNKYPVSSTQYPVGTLATGHFLLI